MLALPLGGSSTPELYHGKYVAGMYGSDEQGVWYEPSLSNGTLFQDAAGTTPVTAVEQPVGLMKDKSGRGNHAKQTTSADRPVFSARYNLLTATEDFGSWGKVNVITNINTVDTYDPLGGRSATKIISTINSGSHEISQNITRSAGVAYRGVLYAKPGGYNYLRIGLSGIGNIFFNLVNQTVTFANVGVTGSATLVNDNWVKCVFDIVSPATGLYSTYLSTSSNGTEFYSAGDGTSGIYIWGASLVPANQAHLPYQRVNTATDYDADPVKFPPYLKFNGTNSGMVTNSIDFTATDKMTVFCGDSCAWDNKPQVLFGLGGNVNSTNPGVFWLMAFDGGGSAWSALYLRQSLRTIAIFAPNLTTLGFITNVRAASLDISAATRAEEIKMRVNGATSTVYTYAYDASAGDGNFTANQLYIGASFGGYRFNGNLYSLIIRGAATDDAHLTHAEKYVGYKTGVSL